jgi:NAD-dependent dihydropyrimidine dehydrogenase PreA subunit
MIRVNVGCCERRLAGIKPLKRARREVSERRRVMTYVITEPCIGTKDQSCVEVCPVDCIYDAGDHFMINPEECIDCGACEPECPVEAIYPEDEVPEDQESYIAKAARFHFLGVEPG